MKFVYTLFLLLLSGCSSMTEPDNTSNLKFSNTDEFKLEKHANGERTQLVVIGKSNEKQLFDDLDSWLGLHASKVKKSFTSYVPMLVVSTDTLSLNFVGNDVVVSVRAATNEVWTQYVVKSDSEMTRIKKRLLELIEPKTQAETTTD